MEVSDLYKEVLKPSETVGKQLYLLAHIYVEINGLPKEVSNRSELFETVEKQLYLLILHLYGQTRTLQRGLKQV